MIKTNGVYTINLMLHTKDGNTSITVRAESLTSTLVLGNQVYENSDLQALLEQEFQTIIEKIVEDMNV